MKLGNVSYTLVDRNVTVQNEPLEQFAPDSSEPEDIDEDGGDNNDDQFFDDLSAIDKYVSQSNIEG